MKPLSTTGPGIARVFLAALLALVAPSARAEPLSLDAAIRGAWSQHPGLRASQEQVDAARADADAARHGWLPTLGVSVKGVHTNEPLMAFGIRLDQAEIAQADFDPARLNHPDAATAFGAGVTLSQPLYAGGRIAAGTRATAAQAAAQEASHEARRQELALGVVQAYFGTQAASEGLRYADDLLAQASETERFVRSRNGQGLALDADVARATAFRAQAEAERATAAQRLATARSALALLAGEAAADAPLATPLAADAAAPTAAGDPSDRPSLRAARLQRDAAQAGQDVARGSLLPSVGAQASAETLRTSGLGGGATWYALGVVARWDLSLGDADRVRAAGSRASAAASALAWEERQARREVDEARRAIETADARVGSAAEAVAASQSASALRRARHAQGLLPLTDVLDAESALAGARALILQARLEARVARARLALAQGEPVEGVKP
ncbi:MAG: TolC family protein [Anaeromyxobacteraceae bacterium]